MNRNFEVYNFFLNLFKFFLENKLNRKSLLAQGIPKSMTEDDIRNLFPKCLSIYLSKAAKGKT